jgi:integrase
MATAIQSIRPPRPDKPSKPYPDFPLFPHATKRWAKKIRGKLHYFGPWNDWRAALDKYNRQKDALFAGRKPREDGDGVAVRDLLNRFLTSKRHLVDTRELTERSFQDYFRTCDRIGKQFGLNRLLDDLVPDDFEGLRKKIAQHWGPVALGNEIQRVRVVFKYAYDAGLVDKPMRYGPGFKRPSKKVLRKARNERGPRMFQPTELQALLGKAGLQLKAMILLGINCGFGNADCGTLPLAALDLAGGWVNFPRPKTGIPRRCPLWPETVEALETVLAKRREPENEAEAGLVFITKYGKSWAKNTCDNPISKETAKLLKELGIVRKGLNFYSCRHSFETIGGEAKDQVAVDHIMGHARDDMASVYREAIGDERLRAITHHVRTWLFGAAGKEKKSRRTKVHK